jgi:hypothetical protein
MIAEFNGAGDRFRTDDLVLGNRKQSVKPRPLQTMRDQERAIAAAL